MFFTIYLFSLILIFGNKTLIIQCGEAKKQLELEIEEFPYAIAPVTTNLAFDFNPEGRTNEDAGFDIFEDRGVTWTVSENFDWSNGGWKTDEEGSSYFCIKAGTSVDFNYNLFEDTNTLGTSTKQENGKEFKVVFKTANVADSRATWLSCLANTEKNKPTGIQMGIQMDIQNGYVSSDLNTLTIPYSEEDIIEFDMNIVPFGSSNEKNIPMIMTYEDGTPVQPIVLTDETASFTQAEPVPITIGSTDCDVHLYRMKAYSSFLSDKQILDNFIADARTGTEKADRYLRNQIYNALTGKLTPEEYKHIQEHVEITHNILAKIHMSDDFEQITDIACSHHEKFDGTGYHRGLKGVDIPFGGRILAVSDVFDAITSKRHYRDKMPIEKVIDIQKISQDTVSLDTPVGEEEDSKIGDFVEDETIKSPVETAAQLILKEQENQNNKD